MTLQPHRPELEASVIVPAYNATRYLGATLDSLLAQRRVEFEVIVVDDRSTDGTHALVAGYAQHDRRVRYACTPSNCGGPAGPRNLGVAQARADWVAFCDADDLWHVDKLRAQLDCARSSGASLVCTAIEAFPDGAKPKSLAQPLAARPRSHGLGLWAMLLKNRVATSSVLCRRQLILDAGGFNTDRGMVAVEDYDLWLRSMTSFGARIVRIDHRLVGYRHLPGSLSASKWRQALKILRVHRSIFAIKGWNALFPFVAPVLMVCYITSWLYLRSLVARRA